MKPKDLLGGAAKVTPENMAEALQQAIEIEIATIPTYLYTYYSIDRTPDQESIQSELIGRLESTGKTPDEAAAIALELSVLIMVFANKAGAVIMSVVIEEMLHMALASNVKQAICGMPELVGKSPSEWPAYLPGHEPPFPIARARLSLDQLHTFLQIESPRPLPLADDDAATAIPYTTIGKFYELIEKAIEKYYKDDKRYDRKAAQLVPGRGFYAHNNINTNYYDRLHRSRLVNAGDSGDLVHVVDQKSALKALEEIVVQGEGGKGGGSLGPPGSVDCGRRENPSDFDDPAHEELAHFDKFNELYCELRALDRHFEQALGDPEFDVGSLFVHAVPDNPVTADYPAPLQDLSNLTNALYSYVYVMTEACYRQAGNTQFEIFMFGIHKTMMWILGSLCETLVTRQYVGPDGQAHNAAPTFETWHFNAASSPKQQIIELFEKAAATNGGLSNIGTRIHDLPDVPVAPYQSAEVGERILA